MSAGDQTAARPEADDLLRRPINVLETNLSAAHAALDILLELTYAEDADVRLESLGPKSLGTAIHTVMEQIERAQEAAGVGGGVEARDFGGARRFSSAEPASVAGLGVGAGSAA